MSVFERQILFTVGYPRSGTTFFEKMLYDLFDVSMSNEINFILKSQNVLPKNKILNEQDVDLFLNKLLKLTFFAWYEQIYSQKLMINCKIIKEEIKNNLMSFSISDIYLSVLKIIADNCDRNIIGGKDPSLTSYLNLLNKYFPKCKIIHIIRDGRDIALSMKKVKWGDGNIISTSFYWNDAIRKAREQSFNISKSRYLEVKYEDLLTKPKLIGEILQNFIKGHLNETMTNDIKKYINKYSYKQNFLKWQKEMSFKSIKKFESIAGQLLKDLGYPTKTDCNPMNPFLKYSYVFCGKIFQKKNEIFSKKPF